MNSSVAIVDSTMPLQVGRTAQKLLPGWSRAAIITVLGCLLIPRGVELQLGTIMINLPRVLFTIFSLVAFYQLYTGVIVLKVTLADWFIVANITVIIISALVHSGFDEGLENAIAMMVDMGMAYFIARVFINNLWCYRYFVRIALLVAAISAAFAIVETFTGFSIIRAAWQVFFPKVDLVRLVEQRLGLYRAKAAFREHILLGMYCASVFALAVTVKPQYLTMRRGFFRLCLLLCIVGVFAALSSGPLISLFVCFFFLIYSWFMRNFRARWKLLVWTGAAGFFVLSICSNRGPIMLIIDYMTLDPSTGHFRLEMWKAVMDILRDNWLIGWGWTSDWPRPVWYVTTSIDSFYAVWFVRSGIFAVIAIIGFILYSWSKISILANWGRPVACEALGWLVCTICLFATAITVDIFSSMIFAMYFFLGAGQVLLTFTNKNIYPALNSSGKMGYGPGSRTT